MIGATVEPTEISFKRAISTARGSIDSRPGSLLVIRDEQGHEGRGEVAPLTGWSTVSALESRQQLERCAAQLVEQGLSALITEVAPEVEAAVDLARLSLRAARERQPLWQLLGGRSGTVQVNALIGASTPEAVTEAARAAIALGYRSLKLKIGFEDDAARISALGPALNDEVVVRLDANAGWTLPHAVSMCRLATEVLGPQLDYIEDPVASLSGVEELRDVVDVPIALDELIRTRLDLDFCLDNKLVEVVVVKPPLLGGISRVLTLVVAAAAAEVDVVVSSMFDGPIGLTGWCHLAAAVHGSRAHGLGTAEFLDDPDASGLVPHMGAITL